MTMELPQVISKIRRNLGIGNQVEKVTYFSPFAFSDALSVNKVIK
jgi:hypothetical protein